MMDCARYFDLPGESVPQVRVSARTLSLLGNFDLNQTTGQAIYNNNKNRQVQVYMTPVIFTLFRRRQRLVLEIICPTLSMTTSEKFTQIRCNVRVCAFCLHRDGDNARIKMASNKSKCDLLLALVRISNREAGN